MRKKNKKKQLVNEAYVKILQKICSQASASIHLDKLISGECPLNRGVRKEDPLSPKLVTIVIEEAFTKADIYERINVNGENLTNLRFADDVVLFNEKKNKPQQNKWENI